MGLMTAAVMAAAGMGAAFMGQPAVTVQAVAPRKKEARRTTGTPYVTHWGYAKKERVTVRQHQRAARKKRNQARNRRAHRG
jgi:hypothetical protein